MIWSERHITSWSWTAAVSVKLQDRCIAPPIAGARRTPAPSQEAWVDCIHVCSSLRCPCWECSRIDMQSFITTTGYANINHREVINRQPTKLPWTSQTYASARLGVSVTTNHGTSLSMDCKYEPYPPSPPIKVCLTSPPLHARRNRRLKQRPRGDGSDKSEKRASLLQEDHLNWPNNQISIKPLLTL